MKLASSVLLLALVAGTGCEKADAPSGTKPSASEVSMLASLPGGNLALFGGNYMQFQKYMQDSPLNKVMGSFEQAAPGLTEWMNCFVAAKDVTMLGGVKLSGSRVDMRFVMKGIDAAFIQGCAKRAGFPTTMDPDGKFIGLEMPNPLGPVKSGYLVLADGALYTRQSLPFPMPTSIPPVERATLEAEIAGLAQSNAGGDTELVSHMKALDRSKAIWFVGSGAGTPAADKLGIVRGTMDIASGLTMDITAQIKDAAIANQIAEGIPQLKKQAGQMGPAIKSVIDKLQFSRNGDRLRFAISIDNAQLTAMIEQLGPMIGAGLGQ